MKIEYSSYGTKKEIQGFDIFIDDKWFGSRRTQHECQRYVDYLTKEKRNEKN